MCISPNPPKPQVAVYGGSFNPPHIGHVVVMSQALIMGNFEKIMIVPCLSHPFEKNKELVGWDYRYEMCKLAFDIFDNDKVNVNVDLCKFQYSIDMVNHLGNKYDLTLIIGRDIVNELPQWKDYQELKNKVRFYVVDRFKDISSTKIREKIKNINTMSEISNMIPQKVIGYIAENELYSIPGHLSFDYKHNWRK